MPKIAVPSRAEIEQARSINFVRLRRKNSLRFQRLAAQSRAYQQQKQPAPEGESMWPDAGPRPE
jgi:hypothetical protein